MLLFNRSLVIVCVLFFCANISVAQDRLITTMGDTVFCKIVRVDGQYLVFTMDNEPRTERKIAFALVDGYDRNFVKQPVQEAQTQAAPKPQSTFATKPSRSISGRNKKRGFMLGIAVGYSHRLAKVPDGLPAELEKYIRKLKSSFALKLDAAYFFGRFFGLGANYSMAYTGNRLSNVIMQDQTGQLRYGDIADRISMHFVGLHLTSRFGPKSGNGYFLPGVTVGYTAYQNKATVIDDFTLTSGTFSLSINLAADFRIGTKTYLGMGVDYITGILNYYKYKDATSSGTITMRGDARDNLSRLEFSMGLRYYFTPGPRPAAVTAVGMPPKFR